MLRRPTASRRLRVGLRVAVALAAVGLGVLATLGRWAEVRAAAGHLGPAAIGAALVAVLAGLFATMLSWRAVLADLGSALPIRTAMRIFFLGQLGKYLPGSVWWLIGQAELGSDQGVPRRRTAAAGVVAVALSLIAGLVLAALLLPLLAAEATTRYWPAFAVVPLLIATLHPRVINGVLNRALRLARREPLEHPISGRGVLAGFVLATAAWVAFGVQVAVLAADLGASGPRTVALSIGGFALAWSVGFLAVVVPAGIGVREAALVAALAPELSAGSALVVAVLSRVLMFGADVAWAGFAAGVAGPPSEPARSDRVQPI